ncbi:ABC transporter substrate-binding protein [Bradyrhizobium centrosematis]|uniref:ABC transporter substrate-binding protein n=1 Tax=Bradyrhizobium centrosematis TaxID=1300039 RepID=UPI00388FEB60
MIISRRSLMKASIAAGTALALPSLVRAQTVPAGERTARMVMGGGDLRIFDPVTTTATITYNHALAIYDMLFALDSKYTVKPQMVDKWSVSEDKKVYTFALRDGLGWHDRTPVTASDCVASIRRWAEASPGGKLLKSRGADITRKDDKTFAISLKEPLGILIEILGNAGATLFIMREKDASRPPTELVTANIGSGPFKFNHDLAKPGASFTYDRNEKYVPRDEPADGFAGGKVAKFDRIVWENIADQQTAFAALQAGELDYLGEPPSDLYQLIDGDQNLQLEVVDPSGSDYFVRMNCLQKPFNNVKARQAILHLIDQRAYSVLINSEPRFSRPVTSLFGNSSPCTNAENTGWFQKGGNPELAKQLFKEAGYAGERIVILDPTNVAWAHGPAQLLALSLRKIGINAELSPMDWGQLVTVRGKKGPVEDGGWSILISAYPDFSLGYPITTAFMSMNGEEGWYGWPKDDAYEALRLTWPNLETFEERKIAAQKMQRLWWDDAPAVFLGNVSGPIARRKSLVDIIHMPGLRPLWNMQKASS